MYASFLLQFVVRCDTNIRRSPKGAAAQTTAGSPKGTLYAVVLMWLGLPQAVPPPPPLRAQSPVPLGPGAILHCACARGAFQRNKLGLFMTMLCTLLHPRRIRSGHATLLSPDMLLVDPTGDPATGMQCLAVQPSRGSEAKFPHVGA